MEDDNDEEEEEGGDAIDAMPLFLPPIPPAVGDAFMFQTAPPIPIGDAPPIAIGIPGGARDVQFLINGTSGSCEQQDIVISSLIRKKQGLLTR